MFRHGHDIGIVRPYFERPKLGMLWWRPPKRPLNVQNGEEGCGKRAKRCEYNVLLDDNFADLIIQRNTARELACHLQTIIATRTLTAPFQPGDIIRNYYSLELGSVTGYDRKWPEYIWFRLHGYEKWDKKGYRYRHVWCQSKIGKRKAIDMEHGWWDLTPVYTA